MRSGRLATAVRRVLATHGVQDAPLGQTLPTLGGLAGLVDRAARFVPAPLLRRVLRGAQG